MTDSNGFTYSTPTVDKPVYVTETYYNYDPSSKNTIVSSILGNDSGWLASPCVLLHSFRARFYVRLALSSVVDARTLCYSDGDSYSSSYGVRPLVTLSSSQIKLTGIGEGTSSSPYEIAKK